MEPTQTPPVSSSPVSPLQTTKKSVNTMLIVGIIVDLILIGGAGAFALMQYTKAKNANTKVTDLTKQVSTLRKDKETLSTDLEARKETTGENNIDKNGFQAVFFKDGNVYFGKITNISETQVTLTDIYYLRVGSGSTGGVTASDPNTPTGDVSLTKLGNELHGPQDTMYIERKEVNFWENLKNDGQVAKAIVEYEKNN